jgi:DUF1365 family protein
MRITAPNLPSLVEGVVDHTRHTPVVRRFRHAHYQWLVDVDHLPEHPWPLSLLTRFHAEDHLDRGRLGGGIRGDVERLLRNRGVELPWGTTVLMLAHARTLGHVFDPLTVFWCISPDHEVVATVLEVHNTYGERHAYVIEIDDRGRGRADKAFYVSPFNDTSGCYAVHLQLGPARVSVTVRLERDSAPVLTASVTGATTLATPRRIVTVALRHLLMTQRVSLLIRWHGVCLWMRRLRIEPRPPHTEEAVR